jgi:hypothetical protein
MTYVRTGGRQKDGQLPRGFAIHSLPTIDRRAFARSRSARPGDLILWGKNRAQEVLTGSSSAAKGTFKAGFLVAVRARRASREQTMCADAR